MKAVSCSCGFETTRVNFCNYPSLVSYMRLVLCLSFPLLYAALSYTDVEYTGLEALYNATNGHQWTASGGWRDSTLGVCNWYGVTCDDKSQNVTSLSLSNNNLAGDLSSASELSYMASLEQLDLSSNGLYGAVPVVLGLMPALKVLDLSGNELSSFPSTWGSGASALRYLSVQGNKISG